MTLLERKDLENEMTLGERGHGEEQEGIRHVMVKLSWTS